MSLALNFLSRHTCTVSEGPIFWMKVSVYLVLALMTAVSWILIREVTRR